MWPKCWWSHKSLQRTWSSEERVGQSSMCPARAPWWLYKTTPRIALRKVLWTNWRGWWYTVFRMILTNKALELGPHNIRVNAVNPTVALTAMGTIAWSDPKKSAPMLAKIPVWQTNALLIFSLADLPNPEKSRKQSCTCWVTEHRWSTEHYCLSMEVSWPVEIVIVHFDWNDNPDECMCCRVVDL